MRTYIFGPRTGPNQFLLTFSAFSLWQSIAFPWILGCTAASFRKTNQQFLGRLWRLVQLIPSSPTSNIRLRRMSHGLSA